MKANLRHHLRFTGEDVIIGLGIFINLSIPVGIVLNHLPIAH